MSNRLIFAVCTILATAAVVSAQTTDSNPAHSPDVFLDNHRPLIGKKDKAPTTRTVTGKVVNESGQPLEGAVVTLKNAKSSEKTTFFTKKDGRYSFEDLSFTVDYQLQARYKDANSEARKLSQYDRSASVVRILQISDDSNTKASTEAKKDDPASKK